MISFVIEYGQRGMALTHPVRSDWVCATTSQAAAARRDFMRRWGAWGVLT